MADYDYVLCSQCKQAFAEEVVQKAKVLAGYENFLGELVPNVQERFYCPPCLERIDKISAALMKRIK